MSRNEIFWHWFTFNRLSFTLTIYLSILQNVNWNGHILFLRGPIWSNCFDFALFITKITKIIFQILYVKFNSFVTIVFGLPSPWGSFVFWFDNLKLLRCHFNCNIICGKCFVCKKLNYHASWASTWWSEVCWLPTKRDLGVVTSYCL